MTKEATELEPTQELEVSPSTEEEKVSEEKTEEKVEPITFTTEQEAEIEKRFQSRRDKELNPYREKRESDSALIRSLSDENKGLKMEAGGRKLSKAMETILTGDEEEGVEPDKTEARRKAWAEVKETIKGYNEKAAEVEEAVRFVDSMTEKLPAKIVKEFGLDDPNPNVRAVNGAKLLDETAEVFKYSENFLMVVEDFLPKGDELRKQIEEIVEGLAEFTDEKSKKLYLKDKLQGVKVTPRKKPLTPSDTTGGSSLEGLSARELLVLGEQRSKKK